MGFSHGICCLKSKVTEQISKIPVSIRKRDLASTLLQLLLV